MDGGHSAGEIGGIVAGVITVGAALGKGFLLLADWIAKRTDKRALEVSEEAKRLKAYRRALDKAAQEYRQGIERRLAELEGEVHGWRRVTGAVCAALIEATAELRHNEHELVLARVVAPLRELKPEDLELTPALAGLVAQLYARGGDDGDSDGRAAGVAQ